MDRRSTTAIALGVAGFGLLALGTRRTRKRPSARFDALTGTRKRRKLQPPVTSRGSVVCPLEVGHIPVSLSGAVPGDFVAIRLADNAGTFTEVVWGIIEAIHGKGSKIPGGASSSSMVVRLTGSIGSASVTTPNSAMHGFDIGSTLLLEDNCAWEHFRSSAKGMALCGLYGQDVSGTSTPASAAGVVSGEEVLLFLAPVKDGTVMSPGPGWDVPDPVWARITDVSSSKSVLRVMLLDDPIEREGVSLRKGDSIDISRDCIFDVRPGGS